MSDSRVFIGFNSSSKAQKTKNRLSYIRLQSHPIIENLLRKALKAIGIESSFKPQNRFKYT